MIGLDKVTGGYIQSLREREVAQSRKARLLRVAYFILCKSITLFS